MGGRAPADEVVTGSGVVNYHFRLLPSAQSPPFHGDVLPDGPRYTFRAGPYNETFHLAAGEVFQSHFHEAYVSDSGARLTGSGLIHVTRNANGELTVDISRIEPLTCSN